MKKLFFIGAVCLLSSFVPPTTTPTEFNINETINTLEDMEEWLEWDIQRGKVDSNVGKLYLINIENCLYRLKQL
jgi:hypothetical protein